MPTIRTDTQTKLQGKRYLANAPAGIGDNVATAEGKTLVEERLEEGPLGGADRYTLTAEERQRYGIRDDETYAWVRDPQFWNKFGAGDRVREARIQNPGARPVLVDGELVRLGHDLVLMARPKSGNATVEQRERTETARFERRIDQQDWDDQLDRADRVKLKERVEANKRRIREAGLAARNTPTAGRSYESVIAQMASEEWRLEEARHRRGGRHITEAEREAEAKLKEAVAKHRSGSGRKYFVMG